jgi:hypothetical protein
MILINIIIDIKYNNYDINNQKDNGYNKGININNYIEYINDGQQPCS